MSNKPEITQERFDNIASDIVTAFGWAAPSQKFLLQETAKAILRRHMKVVD